MFMFFVLFLAMYILAGSFLRLVQVKTAGTPFGAAVAWIH